MGDIIRAKLRKYTAAILLCIVVLAFCSLYVLWQYELLHVDDGMIRVMSNTVLSAIENMDDLSELSQIETQLPYTVFDLEGNVRYSTINKYEQGTRIDLHTIGTSNCYIVPVMKKETEQEDGFMAGEGACGYLLYVDTLSYQRTYAPPLFLRHALGILFLLFAMILLFIRRTRMIRADIWEPVKELHMVMNHIAKGDMEMQVTYDYDGVIGTLCHDFECMREEIIDSHQRELRLQEKERALYASISHDLKTPLASVTGYLEELLYGVVTKPDEVKKVQQRMLEKAMVLNKLIDDILQHSKASLGQLTIQKREVYAREYFKQLLKGYETDAKLNHYEFTYQLPENVLLLIDPDRIAQVIQNLIDNAVKYRKGPLSINVSFEINPAPVALIVSVCDNGSGIDAQDQPFIFDLFYRGNKSRTQDIPGSGLGLNISRYIVEEHGGRIECDSIAGAGTTISFSIPY